MLQAMSVSDDKWQKKRLREENELAFYLINTTTYCSCFGKQGLFTKNKEVSKKASQILQKTKKSLKKSMTN